MAASLREGDTCHSIVKCSPAARATLVPYLAIHNNLGTEYSCTLRLRVNSNTWDTFEKYIFRRVISTCKECRLTLDFNLLNTSKIQIVLDSCILLFFFSTIDCFSLGRKDLRRDEKWNGRRHNKKVFWDTNNTEGEFDKAINHIHTWCTKLSLNGTFKA